MNNKTASIIFTLALGGFGCRGALDRSDSSPPPGASIQRGLGAPTPPVPLGIPNGAVVAGSSIGPLPLSSGVAADGAFTISVPLDTPPALFGTPLSLTYSSTAGNGILGRGWKLSAGQSSIARCKKTIATEGVTEKVTWTTTDVYCLDGRKLVPVPGKLGEYRTEEWSDLRVVAGPLGNDQAPTSFTVATGDGIVTTYGQQLRRHWLDVNAYGFVQQNVSVASEWLVTRREDPSGNAEEYHYTVVDPNVAPYGIEAVLQSIAYFGAGDPVSHRSIVFVYDGRNDPAFRNEEGTRTNISYLLSKIQMVAPNPVAPGVVWQYNLGYAPQTALHRALLASIEKCGALGTCARAKTFTYESKGPIMPISSRGMLDLPYQDTEGEGILVADLDGNGKDEKIYDYIVDKFNKEGDPIPDKRHFELSTGAPLTLPGMDLKGETHIVASLDLESDGSVELLEYRKDVDGYFLLGWNAATKDLEVRGSLPYNKNDLDQIKVLDVDGDGLQDLAGLSLKQGVGTWVFLLNQGDGTFGSFIPLGPQILVCGASVMDTDGDGRSELLLWEPGCAVQVAVGLRADNTLIQKPVFRAVETGQYFGATPYIGHLSGDFNGDGLIDLLYIDPYGGAAVPARVRWNLGGSFGPFEEVVDPELVTFLQTSAVPPPPNNVITPDSRARSLDVHDWNGDGRDDLLVHEWSFPIAAFDPNNPHPGTPIPAKHWHILFVSNGDMTFTKYDTVFAPPIFDPNDDYEDDMGDVVTTGDFDGDGKLDAILGGPAGATNSWYQYMGSQNAEPDRVVEVRDDGAALPQAQAVYGRTVPGDADRSSCGQPDPTLVFTHCMMRALPVVRSLWGTQHPYGELFRFEDPRFDRLGRGFLGFRVSRTWIPRIPMEQTTTFDPVTRVGTVFPYAGRPVNVTTVVPILDDDQAKLVSDLTVSDPPPFGELSVPARVTSVDYRYAEGAGQIRADKSWRVDLAAKTSVAWDTATPVSVVSTAGARKHIDNVPGPGATKIELGETYAFDEYDNLVDHAAETVGGLRTETHTTFSSSYVNLGRTHVPIQRSEVTYKPGQPAPPPVVTTYGHTPDKRALPTTVSIDVAGDPDQQSTQMFLYNARGQATLLQVAAPDVPVRQTHVVYDDTTQEGLFVSQRYDDLGRSTWFATHPALGRVVMIETERGDVSSSTYDDLGRLRSLTPAVGPAISYGVGETFSGNAVDGWLEVAQSADGAISSVKLDALGRPIEETHQGFDGSPLVAAIEYGVNGRVRRQTEPDVKAPSKLATELVWDSLGRLRAQTQPNGAKTTQSYKLLESTSLDAVGRVKRTIHDADGNVVRVEEGDPAHPLVTQFVNGPAGPTAIIDPNGTTLARGYDGLGRQTEVDSPDSGHLRTYYNGLGEVVAVERNGQVSKTDRDAFGRPVQTTHPEGKTTWTWDSAANGLGRLATVTSPDGVETSYTYDTHGRPTTQTWRVNGTDYTFGIGYDANGRVAQLDYPGTARPRRLSVRYSHVPGGFVSAVEVSDPLVAGQWKLAYTPSAYDPRGGLLAASFGNGVTQSNSYEPLSGALATTVLQSGGSQIQALGYSYWDDGRLAVRTDSSDPAQARTDSYVYDVAGRLSFWTLAAPGLNQKTEYLYEAGNLTDILVNGALQEHRTYGVTAGPHALTKRKVVGVGDVIYDYDALGRLTKSSDGLAIPDYNDADLPRQIDRGGSVAFAYDAGGARVVKSSASGETTVTLGGLFEERKGKNGVLEVFHINGPEGEIGQLVFDAAKKEEVARYVHADRQGTVSLVTDEVGKVVSRPFVEPFGAHVDFFGKPMGYEAPAAFAGHDYDDDLGLINMKGRLYDPAMKRFTSPDPLVTNPLAGLSYNRYGYVSNDPINRVDPSGYAEHVVCRDMPGGWGLFCYGEGGGGTAPPPSSDGGDAGTDDEQGGDSDVHSNDPVGPPPMGDSSATNAAREGSSATDAVGHVLQQLRGDSGIAFRARSAGHGTAQSSGEDEGTMGTVDEVLDYADTANKYGSIGVGVMCPPLGLFNYYVTGGILDNLSGLAVSSSNHDVAGAAWNAFALAATLLPGFKGGAQAVKTGAGVAAEARALPTMVPGNVGSMLKQAYSIVRMTPGSAATKAEVFEQLVQQIKAANPTFIAQAEPAGAGAFIFRGKGNESLIIDKAGNLWRGTLGTEAFRWFQNGWWPKFGSQALTKLP